MGQKQAYRSDQSIFQFHLVLNISPRTVPGGEGMAFILAIDSNLPENSQGQWLGIVNAKTNGNSQAKIVAVEFDTRKSYPGDVDSNHAGLDVNSIYSIKQVPLGIFGINLSAGVDVMVRIQYEENLTVFIGEDARNLVFSEPIDLSLSSKGGAALLIGIAFFSCWKWKSKKNRSTTPIQA
ncbi:hypothetical protein GH714_036714 [Hevea brasiliensis]|uniref:Legume lectin domain-containing protein n=1 Tax=Hevea brasiliensis TaxID=3981 RepID=A0A6A6KL49_HEVBR|nr:hypothetical protein GH714_036714 [Hevea brasiliensis]